MKLIDLLSKPQEWLFRCVSNTDGYQRWLREERRRIAGEMRISMLSASSPEFARLKEQQLEGTEGPMRAMIRPLYEAVLPSSESMYVIEWWGLQVPNQAVLPEGFVDLHEGYVYDEERHRSVGFYYILYGADENDRDRMLVFMNPSQRSTSILLSP